MASAERLARDGADFSMGDDEECHTRRETFEISDPSFENGVPRRYRGTFWSRLLGLAIRSRRRPRLDAEQEEGDGLLYSPDVPGAGSVPTGTHRSCCNWCIYGGNAALSILMLLLVLNLLFGFATFLQLPKRPDPFLEWGKPGTSSEGLSWYPTDFLRDVVPIPCHSHNDYWRKVPLFSALYTGCIGVEADVWAFPFNDELYVGHNNDSLTKNRTFQSLYINPLVTILERQNLATSFNNVSGHGVFDTHSKQSLTLLVDLKTDGAKTWPLVLQQLEPLRQRGWLSYIENDTVHRRPITVVGSGKAPFNAFTSHQTYRDAFFDAPLDEMYEVTSLSEGEPIQPGVDNIGDSPETPRTQKHTSKSVTPQSNNPFSSAKGQRRDQCNSGTSPTDSYTSLNSYYASTSFKAAIGTIWWGRLSNDQIHLIRGQICGAHRRGLKARYWDTPAWPTSLRNYIWDVLVQEGVDLLNVDDLEAVRSSIF